MSATPSPETPAAAAAKDENPREIPAIAADAEKRAKALGIYIAWRNEFLRGIDPGSYRVVEAASAALVAAIAGEMK
jgi:hypothetical protein